MKKTFVALLLLAGLFARAQEQKSDSVVIRGHIHDLPDSTGIRIASLEGQLIVTFATAKTIQGRFQFEVPVSVVPQRYALLFNHDVKDTPGMWCEVWVKDGPVTVTGKGKLLHTWDVQSDVAEQRDNNRYLAASRSEWDQYQLLAVQRSNYVKIYMSDTTSKAVRKQLALQMNLIDSLTDPIELKIAHNDLRVLGQGAITRVGVSRMKSISYHLAEDSTLRPALLAQYARLTPDQKKDVDAQYVSAKLFPVSVVKVGDPLADTTLFDLEGKAVTLNDLRRENPGKYLLLDFWSIGCGPCVEAGPETKELAAAYADRLVVVGVNADGDAKLWGEFSKEHEITWVNLEDRGGLYTGLGRYYGVAGVPFYVVIDPDGKVVKKWSGYGKGYLTNMVKPVLEQK